MHTFNNVISTIFMLFIMLVVLWSTRLHFNDKIKCIHHFLYIIGSVAINWYKYCVCFIT